MVKCKECVYSLPQTVCTGFRPNKDKACTIFKPIETTPHSETKEYKKGK